MTYLPNRTDFLPTIRYDIPEHAIIVIEGEPWCRAADLETDDSRKSGHILRSLDHPKITRPLSHADLSARISMGAYGYFEHGMAPGVQRAEMLAGLKTGANHALSYLSEKQRHEAWVRFSYVISFIESLRSGFYRMTDEHIFLSLEATYIALKEANGDSKWPIAKPPNIRTFWRWFARLKSCMIEVAPGDPWQTAYLPTALVSRAGGKEVKRCHPVIRAIIADTTSKYLKTERPTYRKIYKEIVTEIDNARALGKLPPKTWVPSETTALTDLRRRISARQIKLSREGAAAATAHFQPLGALREPLRPLERIEVDDWEVHLMTLLRPEILALLPPEERTKLATERLFLCLAVDAATGVTLALQLSGGPRTDRVKRVARLCYTDQTNWLVALGVRNRYSYHGRVGVYFSDNGLNLANAEVQRSVSEAGSTWIPGPKSTPRLRPIVEATFAKADLQALDIPGRTFANPLDRGDYNPERRACLTADDLLLVLTAYLRDVAVFEGVETRFDESPHEAWVRLTEAFAFRIPPDREKLRVAFGLRVDRTLTSKGVRYMHNYYVGPHLHELHMAQGDQTVEICADELDIGSISVRDPRTGTWLTARARRPWLDGVPMFNWLQTLQYIERQHAGQRKLHDDTVRAALKRISETCAAAAAKNLYLEDPLTQDQVDLHEARLRIGFVVTDDPTRIEAREQAIETPDLFARAHRVTSGRNPPPPIDAPDDTQPGDAPDASKKRSKYKIAGLKKDD